MDYPICPHPHTDITRSIFLPLCQQGTIHHTLFTRPVKSHYFPAPLQTIKRTLPSSWSLGRSCYKVNTLTYKRNDHKNLLRPHTGHRFWRKDTRWSAKRKENEDDRRGEYEERVVDGCQEWIVIMWKEIERDLKSRYDGEDMKTKGRIRMRGGWTKLKREMERCGIIHEDKVDVNNGWYRR